MRKEFGSCNYCKLELKKVLGSSFSPINNGFISSNVLSVLNNYKYKFFDSTLSKVSLNASNNIKYPSFLPYDSSP